MKILIYGASGWIGNQFCDICDTQKILYSKGQSRVDDIESVKKELHEINPTHVISFIGRTHGTIDNTHISTIDYLEHSGKLIENINDNLFSPLSLGILCKERDIHYTYLGTGCIFTYDNEHPYGETQNGFIEDSLPNFFGSSYSIVKGFTDRLFHLYEDSFLNLRIRMPITHKNHPRNFITKITNYEYICSIPNSMTVLPELLPLVIDMMETKKTGTINLTNPGLISHNEILEMYRELVDKDFTWKNFSKEDQSQILKSERSNNYLDTQKLTLLYPQILSIKDSIRKCLLEYKK